MLTEKDLEIGRIYWMDAGYCDSNILVMPIKLYPPSKYRCAEADIFVFSREDTCLVIDNNNVAKFCTEWSYSLVK